MKANRSSDNTPSPWQQSFSTDASTDIVSSVERRQYNKALKAMYEIVRLGAKRLDTSGVSRKDSPTETTVTSEDTLNEEQESTRKQYRQQKSRKSLSFEDTEEQSSSSINNAEIQKVYTELMQINRRLQRENQVLQDREQRLRDRETALREAEQLSETTGLVIDKLVDQEIEKRCQEIAQSYEDQIFVLGEEIKKQKVEVRRLKDSFNTIKTANDALKKQLTEVQDQNRVLEAQAISVQHRLLNLQRKNEFAARQTNDKAALQQDRSKSIHKSTFKSEHSKTVSFNLNKFNFAGTLDVLAVLLEWIAEAHLRKPPTFNQTIEDDLQEQTLDFCSALVHDKCLKILPPMADILSFLPTINPKVQESCLQFTYWSIMYMEKSVTGSQRTSMASTFRHIGEELLKPQVIKVTDEGVLTASTKGEKHSHIYFYSQNLNIRLLSSLIILKTLSQVDHLAHVFDVLKNDLRDDIGKQLFLTYDGTNVILPFMKPAQKAFLSSAIDVMLLMSMDSPFLQAFLDSCCNEPWFRTSVNLLQQKNIDEKLIEKLSIVLQRLSKSKSNRRYFEAFQISSIVQEMLRTCDPDNAFLALNLRSLLYNLTSVKN